MTHRSQVAAALAFALGLASGTASADPGDTCISAYEGSQQQRHDGALVRAREELALCRGACPAALAKDCEVWSAEVEAALGHVVVATTLDGDGAIVRGLTIDGVGRSVALGGVIDLDPGAHVAWASSDTGATGETRFVLARGERRTVTVALVARPTDGFSPPTPSIVLATVGGTALLAGAGLAIAGHLRLSELRDTCAPDCDSSDVDGVRTTWIAGGAVAGAGVLALAAAVALVLLDAPNGANGGLAVGRGPDAANGASLLCRF